MTNGICINGTSTTFDYKDAGLTSFCYDANGNQIQKIAGSTTSYAYDAENRMTAVSGAAAVVPVGERWVENATLRHRPNAPYALAKQNAYRHFSDRQVIGESRRGRKTSQKCSRPGIQRTIGTRPFFFVSAVTCSGI